jgi:hypothetical protein
VPEFVGDNDQIEEDKDLEKDSCHAKIVSHDDRLA